MKYFLYFLEITRAKNLSRAAERLYVSQSALSQFPVSYTHLTLPTILLV